MASASQTGADAIRPEDYDPLRPEVRADPYPYYAALRREAPVPKSLPLAFEPR